MKTVIAALTLLSLAAGPTFAAGSPSFPYSNYYWVNPNNPDFTGRGSIGHHLDLNPPNPSGGIPGA